MHQVNTNKKVINKIINAKTVNGNKYLSLKNSQMSGELHYALIKMRDNLLYADKGKYLNITFACKGTEVSCKVFAVSAPFWADDVSFWYEVV